MEEIQTETRKARKKHLSVPLVFAVIFAAIYLLFPVIFLYPVYLIYGTKLPPHVLRTANAAFYPMVKIEKICPAYRSLMLWEVHFLGMDH